jgi:hypothetical protein
VKQRVLPVAILLTLSVPSFALAQDSERGWIDVNFGTASSSQDRLTTAFALPVFSEVGALGAAYPQPSRGADFDFGGGYLFTPYVGFGINISGTAHEDPAGLALTVPHPFFFNRSATDAGVTAESLERTEGAVHLQAVVAAVNGERVRVRLFAGPSHFRIKQRFVEDVEFSQLASPVSLLNLVSITGFQGRDVEGNGWGYHVGADVGWFFTRVVGVGAMVRFSGANVEVFDPLSELNIKLDAGGTQFGGGLRLKF